MHYPDEKESELTLLQEHRELARLEMIADWMDKKYLDPILGFFLPGAGDTLGAAIGLYGIFVATKMRVHPLIIARMLVNLALDALIGMIPAVGAVGDFFFKANSKNLHLLRTRGPMAEATTADRLMVGAAAGFLVLALLAPLVLVLLVGSWLIGQFQ